VDNKKNLIPASFFGKWQKHFGKPLPFLGNGENNKKSLFLFREMAKTFWEAFPFFGKSENILGSLSFFGKG
jgi:hypothetical protein